MVERVGEEMKHKVKRLSIREGRELAELEPPCDCDQCLDEVKSGGDFFTCTREKGHDGDHMAHIPGPSVIATWQP